MKTSSVGISLICKYEGCRLNAYKCPSGVWTIGYGHTAGVKEGDKLISKEEAEALLASDLLIYEQYVKTFGEYNWTQNEFDALVSFTYNCGFGNLQKLLNNGRRTKAEIADKITLYNKSRGVALLGLTKRRVEERNLFMQQASTNRCFPIYTGKSKALDEVMEAIGATKYYTSAKTYKKRMKIAEANGLAEYKGTADQNLYLISLALKGELLIP